MAALRRPLVVAALLLAPAAHAASPIPAGLGGCFDFAGGADERAAWEASIEAAIADMAFFMRPFARSRLRESTSILARIEIDLEAEALRLRRPGRPGLTLPLDGRPVAWRNHDDVLLQVALRVEEPTLLVRFEGERGASTHRYTLGPDDRLTLEVHLVAPRLPGDVKYRLSYARCPAP